MAGAHFSAMCGDCSFARPVQGCTFTPGEAIVTASCSKEMRKTVKRRSIYVN